MKNKLVINGKTLFYKIDCDCAPGGECWEWTNFYSKTKIRKRRKRWLWGSWIEEEVIDKSSYLFKVRFSIKDVRYSKLEVRNAIIKALEEYELSQVRPKEIENGEII